MRRRNDESEEEFRERRRAYKAANIDRIREAHRLYSQRHREQKNAYKRAYRAANIDKAREQERARRAGKPRKRNLEQERAYRAANREKVLAQERARRAANPKKYRNREMQHRIWIKDERIRLRDLPEEWRPIAKLIYETRLEVRKKRHAGTPNSV